MIIDFFLPSPCLICSKIGKPICENCLRDLNLAGFEVQLAELSGFSFSEYSDKASLVVNSIKEKGITAVIDDLAKIMVQTWPHRLASANLVPIPSSPENLKKRGFSHTLLWAKALSRHSNGLVISPVLVSARSRKDQAQLSPEERQNNMAEAFSVKGILPTGPMVLIDDVLTTGATIRAAVSAFEDKGLKPVSFCVFTRVRPRYSP